MLTRARIKLISSMETVENNLIPDLSLNTPKPTMASKLNINLPEFSGENHKTLWFVNQIKELAEINLWDDKTALFFLKSRLTGAALQFFQNDPECQIITKLNDACQKIINFFSIEESPASELVKFQGITLTPGESIKNLAYRINLAAHKAYKFINDQVALDKIKAMQFISALPLSIREKILLEGEKDYQSMVAKAQHIQTIQESLVNPSNPFIAAHTQIKLPPVQSDSDQISKLSQKVETLQISLNEIVNKCPLCWENHPLIKCQFMNQISSQSTTLSSGCTFCGKQNHSRQNCYRLQQVTSQNNRRARNFDAHRGNNQDSHNASFNPASQNSQFGSNPHYNQPRMVNPQGTTGNTIPKSTFDNGFYANQNKGRNNLNYQRRR